MTDNHSTDISAEAVAVLDFWFGELKPEQWWKRDETLDAAIRERFLDLHERLAEKIPPEWLATARGRLAAVIALDQFPRNMFRDDPRTFATDPKALALAKETVAKGLDTDLSESERAFLYLPFEHSEEPEDQAESVRLYRKLGDAEALDFAEKHKLIIDRFGRFPHRNAVLGRETTQEEREFLKEASWFW